MTLTRTQSGAAFLAALLLDLVLVGALPASAAPIGRPHTNEGQWVVGVLGSFDRIPVQNTRPGGPVSGDLRSDIFLAEAAYGFTPDAEFYLRAGASEEEYELGTVRDLGSSGAWGLGIRSVLYESWRVWRILGDIQYLSRPDHAAGVADVDIWEYQIATAVEAKFDDFYPYVGVFFNKLEVESNNLGIYPEQRNDKHLGAYGGIGWEPRPEWAVHAEARLINGPALSGGIAYRF